ncbi:biotin-dependent carboxyltransferase family protein [Pseudoalteromonas 'SMAR']|uniref:5-oxoprolinase subunit C family protein n=1 Tax=Pseudoalteromonas 'SMAR' TaxID=3416908 RepID=UPI003AF24860
MLVVHKPGPLATIQDLGRQGKRHLGVSNCGVLDPLAVAIINRLLGNDDNTPVIEITIGLCEFEFTASTNFAIGGGDLNAQLNDQPIYPGWRYSAAAGDKLVCKQNRDNLRGYLAVAGGFDNLDHHLGSAATDLMSHFGGYKGRKLAAGDSLAYQSQAAKPQRGALQPSYEKLIRFIPGPHRGCATSNATEILNRTIWKVNPSSNRMGIRLSQHQQLTHQQSIATQAVHPGVIQLPPSGEPIILLNDCQTTGGYPIIGSVIAADLRHLSQLGAGDCIHLQATDINQAQHAQSQTQAHLNQLQLALQYKE